MPGEPGVLAGEEYPEDVDPDGHDEDRSDQDDESHTALPPKIEAWRKRSATGAILTGLALGLQEALEKEREDPSITMQTSGAPPKDLPVEADFEFRRPRHSVVNIRPWLVEPSAGEASETEAAAETGEHETE